ncbi:MAG: hypothetical protein ACWGIK_02350 [Achromobacter pulmonis]|uniref:hypothetical protein n=1 Tax=Achromobacter pulmonis TaxID=1389932 RepID=UPI001465EB61|nr:hypothetical protein [Achromobacter pulmonis]CAB3636719.1 hypothetical protein LMG26696_01726 [Achromobacter pulmonis]
MRSHDGDGHAATAMPIARGLSFVELMELLEFSRLRFEAPGTDACATLIGTQEWRRGVDGNALAPSAIYICSTLDALRDAVLPPADARLDIDMPSLGRVRLMATMRRQVTPLPQPCLRVDLQALVRRVLVPAEAPPHLYDLVRHVVMARLWIEVARI